MAKLNQIIAVEKTVKAQTHSELSELYKTVQKAALFNGFSKVYQKKFEDGEDLPAESQRVQFTVPDVLRSAERTVTALMDITARKDFTNCVATADVIVDDVTIISKAPVTFLLYLEKQVLDLKTYFSSLPVLDPAEDWKLDSGSGINKAAPTSTHRTKKVQKPIVLYDATPEHPAQTQLIVEDVIAGFWVQTKQSGAIGKLDRDVLVEKAEKLLLAIKMAREAANSADEVTVQSVGKAVFTYLL